MKSKLILIPPDFKDESVVPICIRTVDDGGRRVYRGWIDAVWPVADPLRQLAHRLLGDVNHVSELTEASVHGLSARYGHELGRAPSSRIFADANWRARDMAAGGRRARVGRDIELRREMLNSLKDPYDFTKAYEDRDFFERLEERLRSSGRTEALLILQMYLSESEDEIAEIFGIQRNSQDRNTLTQRFRRAVNQTLKLF